MKALVLGACLGALLLCSNSYGFEFAGFRSGMTLAEAELAGSESGHPLTPIKNKPDNYWIGRGVDASGTVLFCQGLLASVSLNSAGGLDAFASQAQTLETRYGQPAVTARSGYSETGLISYVQLMWSIGDGEDVTLILTSYQSGLPYLSTSYGAFKKLCRE